MIYPSPCKGCEDRWVSDTGRCHTNCQKYIEYREKINGEHTARYENRASFMTDKYEKERAWRVRQHKFR